MKKRYFTTKNTFDVFLLNILLKGNDVGVFFETVQHVM